METHKSKNLTLILLFILLLINISIMLTLFLLPREKQVPKQFDKEYSHHKKNNRCIVSDLQLTAEQEIPFVELRNAHREIMFLYIDSIKNIRTQIIDKLLEEPINISDFQTLAEHIGSLEKDLQLATIEHFMQVKEVLTQEQFSKFTKHFKKISLHKPHHKKHREASPICKGDKKNNRRNNKNAKNNK